MANRSHIYQPSYGKHEITISGANEQQFNILRSLLVREAGNLDKKILIN